MELNPGARPEPRQVEDLRGRRRAPGTRRVSVARSDRGRLGCGAIVLLLVLLAGCAFLGSGRLGLSSFGALGGQPRTLAARNLLYVNSIQAYWRTALPQIFGVPYQTATARFFSGQVTTPCGVADSGAGPFYCPADQHLYIDLAFYQELTDRYGAKGEFAQAYVLAHEYGHHVQNLLGTDAAVRRAQQRDPANAGAYALARELQADCFAGAWAFHARETTDVAGAPLFATLTPDDIGAALSAVRAVAHDTIRRGQRVDESGFTDGSAAQSQQWFTTGYTTGNPKDCNTFGAGLPA